MRAMFSFKKAILMGGLTLTGQSARAQWPYALYDIEARQQAIQSDLYQIGVGIERTRQMMLRAEQARRWDQLESEVRAENRERQTVKHTPNAVRYDENGNLVAAGPRVITVMMDRTAAGQPERLHLVEGGMVLFQGAPLPLYTLTVPMPDVGDPLSYRGHINGSRVLADFQKEGYSDIQWFPFQDKFKAATQVDGALLGTKDGVRHVLGGVRVAAA